MNAKQERRKEQAKRREQKKARFREAQSNGKAAREFVRILQFSATKHTHVIANCGNFGCKRCQNG